MNDFNYSGSLGLNEISKNVDAIGLPDEVLVFDSSYNLDSSELFPLRINALLIVLCRSGKARIGIDLTEYDVEPDTIIVIQPRNYFYLKDSSDDFRCSTVACSRHIVEDVLPKLTDVLPLLLHHRVEPVRKLPPDAASDVLTFYELLYKQLRGPRTPFIRQKVLCILQASLYEMMDINLANSPEDTTPRSRKEEIMARFILSVGEDFRKERQVAYYARKLCITPKHLSSVVKDLSGRTAGDWIENYVVLEAKVLLKTTDLTVQEIALQLNFANQSFFGKYFKHFTGVSPTAFRNATV